MNNNMTINLMHIYNRKREREIYYMIKLTLLAAVFDFLTLGIVLRSKLLDHLPPLLILICWSGEGETALLRRGEVCGEVFFFEVESRKSSLELTDFLFTNKFDSANML